MLGLFETKKKTSQIKILVVDDEPDLVSTVEYRLKFANCSVVTASNGQQGLEQAAAETLGRLCPEQISRRFRRSLRRAMPLKVWRPAI